MKILPNERETVISWLDCENEVEIYTCSPAVVNYVIENGGPQPAKTEADKEGPYSWQWKLPKKKARKAIALFSEAMVRIGVAPSQEGGQAGGKSA